MYADLAVNSEAIDSFLHNYSNFFPSSLEDRASKPGIFDWAKKQASSKFMKFTLVSGIINESVQVATGYAAYQATGEPMAFYPATFLYGLTVGGVVDYFTYKNVYKDEYETTGDQTKTFAQNKLVTFLMGKLWGVPTNAISMTLTYGGMDPIAANQIVERPIGVLKYPLNNYIHNHQMDSTKKERTALNQMTEDQKAERNLSRALAPHQIDNQVKAALNPFAASKLAYSI